MPFVIVCRCGQRNPYGSSYCVACEGKLEINQRARQEKRRDGESFNQFVARCGPLVVEEKPEKRK